MGFVVCPFCHSNLEMPEGLKARQQLLCPCCDKKFLYGPDKPRRLQELRIRVLGLVSCVWARRKCVAILVAFALAIYMCVQLTMVSARMKELDSSVMKLRRQVGAIYSDVSSIESDVNSMESDLSHIKTWGAGH